MNKELIVEIWTDGACKGNPGKGGWGALLRHGHHTKELYGGEHHTTNNRMEMMAVIKALEALKRPCTVHLHVDSQYVKKGITEWMSSWIAKGWKTADKKPVKNQDLWQTLNTLCQQHKIHWIWVKGHAGNEGNEQADTLANKGILTLPE